MNACSQLTMVRGAALLFSIIFFYLISVCVWAGAPLSGSESLLRNARLVFEEQPKQQNYRLVLSGIKKVNGAWEAETEEQLDALVSRKTYELASDFRLSNARASLNKLTRYSGRLNALFSCLGTDCGSSNAWANEFFEIKQLYGTNLSQSYSVWEDIDTQGRRQLLVYYLVERGNGNIMLQEDILISRRSPVGAVLPTATAFATLLYQNRRLVIPGLQLTAVESEWNQDAMLAIVNMLQVNDAWRVYVVGHDANSGSLEVQKERALRYANFVTGKLQSLGVKAERLNAESVGGLVPLNDTPTARVELILHTN